ncbi:M14 family metallopeptidase [Pseudomarimonas arenosa]|uniref:Peptidase M14 domain-containing protein n=1 Tax=Pseudomarimonas arenosa TaxID=2774145 RepID=A0AAW3ZMG1_9GAMM|nr:M14 family metallopeptidase [Pseudomarimonas arenosa]MBD8526928.1 hypothetical protein [Pseudomarimonas arenosa]
MIKPMLALGGALLISVAGLAGAQSVVRYTENQSGNNLRALGYPVPMPVASLTPVDGFRDYASIDARLRGLEQESDQLQGHDVGSTRAGRTVRAYVVSDPDGVDVEGRAESAFFINAGIHAREWGTPEISTYLIERMLAGAEDQALVRYLLDNSRLVIIPVLNVDGFQQTQRFPDQAIVGADPRVPSDWPRDGRMRRKNMLGVDENLNSLADHLLGVDLNRNHPPFWGTVTNGGQLTSVQDLTYRGASAQSEPETQAVLAAAELGPVSRMRLGIDVHSFSQVFFSSNTSRARLNSIQADLLATLGAHHGQQPTANGQPNGKFYGDVPDPPNRGIGVLAEYFAYTWLVPAWTLEIEPVNSGAEYGGTGVSHSGFVLPNSQVRRVREAWAESHLVAFYVMSGPAHLSRIRVRAASDGALLLERRWQYNPQTQARELLVEQSEPLLAGQEVLLELGFSKPMRQRRGGVVDVFPGVGAVSAHPALSLLGANGERIPVDTQAGFWGGAEQRLRYIDDSFVLPMTLPENVDSLQIEVQVRDMAGRNLDSNAATPVDWVSGAWSSLEDVSGVAGDVGGADRSSLILNISTTVAPVGVTQESSPTIAGEGDAMKLSFARSADSAVGAVLLRAQLDGGEGVNLSWSDGEAGPKSVLVPVADDAEMQGDRDTPFTVVAMVDGQAQPFAAGTVRVLDNERPGKIVMRARSDAFATLAGLVDVDSSSRELVADGGRDYRGPSNPLALCQQFAFEAPLVVYGNRSHWLPGDSACTVSQLSGEGLVELHDVVLDGRRENGDRIPLLLGNDAGLSLNRVILQQAEGYAISTTGALSMTGSALLDSALSAAGRTGSIALIEAAQASIDNSSSLDLGGDGAVLLQDSIFAFSGGQPSTIRSLSTAGELADEFRIRGDTLLSASLHLGEPVPVIGPLPICSGVQSGGFNIARTSHCFQPIESDLVGVAVGDTARIGADAAYKPPLAQAIDFGGECGPVDQRGAPRPQAASPGAEPKCDAGSVELGVNPWRGFWIPERSGHGIDMQTRDNILFLLWYTYNEQGLPTAYQAAAPLTGPSWSGRLKLASRDMQSGQVSLTEVGDIGIDFSSDSAARLSWKFDARSSGGSEDISAFAFAHGEPRIDITGTWFPPTLNGYGASVNRRGEVTAIAIYYYDDSGQQRWALGTSDGRDAGRFEMSSYTGFCPDCSNLTFPVRLEPAGTVDLHMLTPQRLRLDSALTYPGQQGGGWQAEGLDMIPLGDPVDNRDVAATLGN